MLSLRHRIALSHLLLIVVCLEGLGYFGLETMRLHQRQWLTQQLLHQAEVLSSQLDKIGLEGEKAELMRVAISENLRIRIFKAPLEGRGGENNDSLELPLFDSGRIRFQFADLNGLQGHSQKAADNSPKPWDRLGGEMDEARSGREGSAVVALSPDSPIPQELATIPRLLVAVPGKQGIVHLTRSLLDLEQEHLSAQLSLLEAALGLAVLAAILSFWLARATLVPLRELSAAACNLAKGDLTIRITIRSGDEIGVLAASFNQLAAQLEERDRLLRQFSADASHELKTPIASLKALSDALLAGAAEEPEQARNFARLMDRELNRLNFLVRDLTELHRLESGPPLELARTDLVQLLLRVQALRSAHPISLKMPATALASIDERRIEQVLLNLLDNARQIGAPRVEIGLEEKPTEWLLWVEDNGSGIPAAEQERIFERFHRIASDRSRKEGGSGLGLAICRRIVEAHRGKIWALSSGGMTRISFTLPG